MKASDGITMDDIKKALVQISPSWDDGATGMGIISGEFIFTCSHVADGLETATDIKDAALFEVRRLHDGAEGTLAMYVVSNTDFMALAPDGLFVNMSECGPTESAFDVLLDEDGEYNAIRPSRLEFPEGRNGITGLPGFFFSPDGQTVHEVDLALSKKGIQVRYESNDMVKGCSGGPIFTRDLHLVGVNANMGPNFPGIDRQDCLGRRIDLCCPMFLYQEIEWRTLHVP